MLFGFKCKLTLRQRLRRGINELIPSVNFTSSALLSADSYEAACDKRVTRRVQKNIRDESTSSCVWYKYNHYIWL
jgi:hypothetical protein